MKKTGLLIAVALLLCMSESQAEMIIGDINNDGQVNITEAIYALRVSAGFESEESKRYYIMTLGGAGYEVINSSPDIFDVSSDGKIIIGCATASFGSGSYDNLIVKMSEEGNIDWAKTYGTSDNDFYELVKNSVSGGYVSVSSIDSLGQGVIVKKLFDDGTIQWQQTYNVGSFPRPASFIELVDGSLLITGRKKSNIETSKDNCFIMKINSSGLVVWTKDLSTEGYDIVKQIITTGDNGFAIIGQTDGYVNSNNSDVWVIKFDYFGNIQWQKKYGLEGTEDTGQGIIQTTDGKYIVAGYTGSFGSEGSGAWVLKIDLNGNIEWQKSYVGSKASSVIVDTNGGYVIAGTKGGAAWLLKIDDAGNIQWEKTYGSGAAGSVYVKPYLKSGYMMVGTTSSYGAGFFDIWVLKVNKEGELSLNCDLISNTISTVFTTSAVTSNHNPAYSTVDATVSFTSEIMVDITNNMVAEEFCY